MLDISEIKGVIFDFDGTIADTEVLYNKCWRKACKFYGYKLKKQEALNLRSLDSNLAKKYLTKLFDEKFEYSLIRKKRKELMSEIITINNGIKQKPNIMNLLSALKKYGLIIALCSASDETTIHQNLKLANINFKFDTIISAKTTRRGKPYPDAYLYACQNLNIKPKNILVVEDSPNGIISAKMAGCQTVMIPDLSLPTEYLKIFIDYTLKDLYEFEKFAKNNFKTTRN